MATVNLIRDVAGGKFSRRFTPSYPEASETINSSRWAVCESKSVYGDEVDGVSSESARSVERIEALLKRKSWPQFRDGVYLDARAASRFQRAAYKVQSCVHILDRSEYCRELAQDYGEPDFSLNDVEVQQIWFALSEASDVLLALVGEMTVDE